MASYFFTLVLAINSRSSNTSATSPVIFSANWDTAFFARLAVPELLHIAQPRSNAAITIGTMGIQIDAHFAEAAAVYCTVVKDRLDPGINNLRRTSGVGIEEITVDFFGHVVAYEQHINDGNARYCSKCGSKTAFYKQGFLKKWTAANSVEYQHDAVAETRPDLYEMKDE